MRYYAFSNCYLSSLQQALQGAHACVELFVKYRTTPDKYEMVHEWAREHKTFMCMNGGNNQSLANWIEFLDSDANPYPWAVFHEDQQSLNGIVTSVGVVLPDHVYMTASCLRTNPNIKHQLSREFDTLMASLSGGVVSDTYLALSQWEIDLIERLSTTNLAS